MQSVKGFTGLFVVCGVAGCIAYVLVELMNRRR